jgi:hypothetical protein
MCPRLGIPLRQLGRVEAPGVGTWIPTIDYPAYRSSFPGLGCGGV